MKHPQWIASLVFIAVLAALGPAPAWAQADAELIPQATITDLQTKLQEAGEAKSSARKKLALKRVIREGDALVEKYATAPNRFEVLGVLFQTHQALLGIDNSATNRRAFLETCEQLAQAPNDYAELRLDADLLLSQAEAAKQVGNPRARGEALEQLVDRYQGTDVETKVIRIAMIMALEFGDTRLIGHLRQVIAQRIPSNLEMISFQRDNLAGQVFGAPFVGQFKASDGRNYRLPMDGMGKTTALYFWTKEGDGLEQLKLIAEGWKAVKNDPERDARSRYQFISFNLDGLPDAGESILRDMGLDWPALHLPGGVDSDIYKTYVRNTPKLLTTTPTGYAAMIMSGSTRIRPDRTWEQNFGSALARSWARADYTKQLQALMAGDFLVMDPNGVFDPTAPPEWKAVHTNTADPAAKLARTASSVPDDILQSIHACFIKPALRPAATYVQIVESYAKIEALTNKCIEAHPEADNLWIVRNRRIVALMGLWKPEGKREHYDAAVKEARLAIDKGMPPGTDVIARFCLAREAMRAEGADTRGVIEAFASADADSPKPATRYALASLLALDVADRPLHEHYRRLSLDHYADHPALWTMTAFHLDRYHRYWMYHPPFTAGWTYGRRMGHFLAVGDADDAKRTLKLELKTLEGETFRIPEDLDGKWAMLEFAPTAEGNRHLQRYGTFINERPFDDVQIITAILDTDIEATRKVIEEKKQEAIKRRRQPDTNPTLVVPGGMNNSVLTQLGILVKEKTTNIVFIRPDGSIATSMSGLDGGKGEMPLNVIEWHDEMAVDEALAKGDLEEAKRLAFAHAPVEQVRPANAPKNWKPKKISVKHLRARAKVYFAMGELDAALKDAHEAYLAVNKKAGWLSMRTDRLDEIEKLKAHIEIAINEQ